MNELQSVQTRDGPHDGHSHGHGNVSTSSRLMAAVSVINLFGFHAEPHGVDLATDELCSDDDDRANQLNAHPR